MEIKQSRSTKLVNYLLQHLEESKREFSDVVAKMIQNKQSYYQDGYQFYGRVNDRTVRVYGHINFDKYLILFVEHGKTYETNDMAIVKELIISYIYLDDSDELLNKILRKKEIAR